jgi:hypothetical protein
MNAAKKGIIMAKYTITNGFHGTSKTTSIKDTFDIPQMDILEALQHEVYSDGDDKAYAKRKLSEIFCSTCSCGGFIKVEKI